MTPEQEARDMLERAGVENAQSFTSGNLVEIANLIASVERLTKELKAARYDLSEYRRMHGALDTRR